MLVEHLDKLSSIQMDFIEVSSLREKCGLHFYGTGIYRHRGLRDYLESVQEEEETFRYRTMDIYGLIEDTYGLIENIYDEQINLSRRLRNRIKKQKEIKKEK